MLRALALTLSFAVFSGAAVAAESPAPGPQGAAPEGCEAVAIIDPQTMINVAFFNFSLSPPHQGKAERFHVGAFLRTPFLRESHWTQFHASRLDRWYSYNLSALEKQLRPKTVGRDSFKAQPNTVLNGTSPLINVLRFWRKASYWNPYTRKLEEQGVSALPFVQKLIAEGASPAPLLGGHLSALEVALKEKDFPSAEYLVSLKLEGVDTDRLLATAVDANAPSSTYLKLLEICSPTFEDLMRAIAKGRVRAINAFIEKSVFSKDEMQIALSLLVDHKSDGSFAADISWAEEFFETEILMGMQQSLSSENEYQVHVGALGKKMVITHLVDKGAEFAPGSLHILFQNSNQLHPSTWFAFTQELTPLLFKLGVDAKEKNADGRSLLGSALMLDGLPRLSLISAAHSPAGDEADAGPLSLIEEIINRVIPASEDSDPEIIDLALESGLPWPLIKRLLDQGYRPTANALARFYSERSERPVSDLKSLNLFFEYFPDFEVNYAALLSAARLKPDHKPNRHWASARLAIFRILNERGGSRCPEIGQSPELLAHINRNKNRESAVDLNRLLVGAGAFYGAGSTFEESPIVIAAQNLDWASVDYFLDLPRPGLLELDTQAQALSEPVTNFLDYCQKLKAPPATIEKIRARMATTDAATADSTLSETTDN